MRSSQRMSKSLDLDAGAIERLLDLGDCSRDLRRRELTREPDACRAVGLTSSPSAGCVGRESIGEHARTAQRDVVAAVNLVGLDPEPLAGVATCPLGGEHAVLTAQQVLRRQRQNVYKRQASMRGRLSVT
jgi:hypothetical protein